MKRLFTLVALLVLLGSFAGCSPQSDTGNPPGTNAAPAAPAAPSTNK